MQGGETQAHSLCFAPVARPDARILILGSLPGAESLRRQQYCANPRNAFWRIMGALFGAEPEAPYPQRLEKLQNAGLALWDVCASAQRDGSLDADIRDMRLNDFAGFFSAHPDIAMIGFNGQSAAKFYERSVLPGLPVAAKSVARRILPSTSPAHASLTIEQKRALWREALTSEQAGLR